MAAMCRTFNEFVFGAARTEAYRRLNTSAAGTQPRGLTPDRRTRTGMNGTTDYDRYETPEVLVTDRTLSAGQKLARLEQWEEDLKAALRATDESMTSVNPGLSGALLQRVMACLEPLRSAEKPDAEPAA
jgi:hypothetical protein